MKFSLEIDSEDAAMVDDAAGEVCRILHIVSGKVESGWRDGMIWDSNGNRCGTWTMDEPTDLDAEEGDE